MQLGDLILDGTNQNQAHVKAIAAHYRRKRISQGLLKSGKMSDSGNTGKSKKCRVIKRKSVRTAVVVDFTNMNEGLSNLQKSSMYNICICINQRNFECHANKHVRLVVKC